MPTCRVPYISIQHLPIELLVHIFQLCIPTNLKLVYIKPALTEAPLLLCWICSQWRDIAMGTPQLWNCLSLHTPQDKDITLLEEITNHWFQRAGTTPLSLKIDTIDSHKLPHDSNYYENPQVNELFHLVLLPPHVRQIRELILSFRHFAEVPALFSQDVDHFQNTQMPTPLHYERLEILHIYLHEWPEDGYPDLMFQPAPSLRKVDLYHVTPPGSLNILLPWSQLTVLTIGDVGEQALMSLLAQCTNLEEGRFTLYEASLDDRAEVSPIVDVVLANLVKLSLELDGVATPDFFHGFQLPALTQFYMDQSYLVDMLAWISPRHLCLQFRGLQRLTLRMYLTSQIADLLCYASSVTRFKVDLEDDHDALFHALTFSDHSQLLPKLEDFTIHCSSLRKTRQFELDPFIEMVVSRIVQPAFPTLRRVKVNLPLVPNTIQLDVESAIALRLPGGTPNLTFIFKTDRW